MLKPGSELLLGMPGWSLHGETLAMKGRALEKETAGQAGPRSGKGGDLCLEGRGKNPSGPLCTREEGRRRKRMGGLAAV